MPFDLKKALNKLDRPPSVQNWARLVHASKTETIKAILSFVRNNPQISYQSGNTAIRDRFMLGIDRATAIAAVSKAGSPPGREPNRDYVNAFFDYDLSRRFPVGRYVDFDRQWFRLSRDVLVPVSPIVILRESGILVPVFSCGWSSISLDEDQRRLFMSVIEDALLSLTDLQDSPAEFLFFPRSPAPKGQKGTRHAAVWNRGLYPLLTGQELQERVELYMAARDEARAILIAEAEVRPASEENSADMHGQAEGQADLFGDMDT